MTAETEGRKMTMFALYADSATGFTGGTCLREIARSTDRSSLEALKKERYAEDEARFHWSTVYYVEAVR